MTTYHHRETRRISRGFIVTALDSTTPRYLQALQAGFAQSSHLSTLLHSRRRITVTPLMENRLQRLAEFLRYPVDKIFVDESEREAATR